MTRSSCLATWTSCPRSIHQFQSSHCLMRSDREKLGQKLSYHVIKKGTFMPTHPIPLDEASAFFYIAGSLFSSFYFISKVSPRIVELSSRKLVRCLVRIAFVGGMKLPTLILMEWTVTQVGQPGSN